jgi:hypothetical protein
MQAQINPSLQALLQTAQMVTPEQGPTVAKQVAQAAMQKMQASAPPGIEALLPGVQQQAAQSAQAAQPATQGDVNQLRQMMSQMAPQGQGISAGADVRMAEGGIVGYAGPDGSEVELDVTGRIKKALRDWYERTERGYMERAGATPEMVAQKLVSAAPAPAEAPEASYSNESRIGLASKPVPVTVPAAPAPSAPRRVAPESAVKPAETGIAATMLPDTRESTAVNPSEAALMYAQMQGKLNDLRETMSRKPAESEAEKAYRAAAMAEYQRGLGGIDAARQRMAESQKKQKEMDFINYLSGMGGGRSLFAGMQKSGQALSQAQQQREASRLAYEDKLEDRRNIVENLKLATLRQDAESARAWTNELRKNEVEISKLGIDLSKDRAGQLARAELSQEEQAGRARENELNRANAMELERMRRATADRPGETERIFNKFNELKAKDPAAAEQYLQSIERIKGLGRPTDRAVLTYAQAAKIVDERLSEPQTAYALMNEEVAAAKKEGRQPRSRDQIREALIRREVQMAGGGGAPTAAPSASTQLPSGVKVTRVGP